MTEQMRSESQRVDINQFLQTHIPNQYSRDEVLYEFRRYEENLRKTTLQEPTREVLYLTLASLLAVHYDKWGDLDRVSLWRDHGGKIADVLQQHDVKTLREILGMKGELYGLSTVMNDRNATTAMGGQLDSEDKARVIEATEVVSKLLTFPDPVQ